MGCRTLALEADKGAAATHAEVLGWYGDVAVVVDGAAAADTGAYGRKTGMWGWRHRGVRADEGDRHAVAS
jgi:hypothetical protein